MSNKITQVKQTRDGLGVTTYHLDNGLKVVFVNVRDYTNSKVKLVQLYREDNEVISLTLDEINMIQEHAKFYLAKKAE